MSLDEKIPRVNTDFLDGITKSLNPGTEVGYLPLKFVQLDIQEQQYLRFNELTTRHKVILLDFLIDCNAAGSPLVTPEELEKFTQIAIDQSPATFPAQTDSYSAVGMGVCTLDAREKRMAFDEFSADYGLGPNQEHLKKIAPYLKGWTIVRREDI